MAVKVNDESIKENIRQDLSWIKRKDPDRDGKLYVISKDEIREAIGRSPDIGDTLMMRMFFELQTPSLRQAVADPISMLLAKRMDANNNNQLDYY
jgi:hypothetical protein